MGVDGVVLFLAARHCHSQDEQEFLVPQVHSYGQKHYLGVPATLGVIPVASGVP